MPNRKQYLKPDKFLLIILAVALILRLYFIISFDYISPDGTQYATLGYNLVHEFKYESNGAHFPDIIQPPLYPLLLGLVSILFSSIMAGKIVSLIFGILLVLLVYHFVRSLKPEGNLAYFAALLIAVHPGLIAVSSQVATESLYLFLMMSIFVQGWFLINNPTIKNTIALAFLYVLAFMTRPEALLFFIVFIFIQAVLLFMKRMPVKLLFTNLIIFALGASFYGISVSQELGYFSISPKINFVRAQGKFQAHQKRLIEKSGQKLDNKEIGLQARYALSADSSQLATHALLYKDAATIDLMNSSKEITVKKSGAVSGLFKYIFYNIKMVAYRIAKGIVTPIVYILFFVLGFFALRKTLKARRKLLLYGFLMITPLSVYLVTHIEERFLHLIIPFGIVFFSAGLDYLAELFGKLISNENTKMVAITALVVLTIIPSYMLVTEKMEEKDYYRQLAGELKRIAGVDSKIASLVPHISFFSEVKYCPVPFASLDGLSVYLKHQKAEFLFIEEKDFSKRPFLKKIVNSESDIFTKLKYGETSNTKYWLYQLKPTNPRGSL
ncbi:MAG: hypothetical protein D8M58_13065 [Calditrichaeota bacterium]|nr:MAG: hypothetical protein DWQ03_13850 [Calditrichota bacterium]MBL1206330.1 hypothetical protein [Calditrichota bacterium]NOG46156.1 hypothetical protein [Calditrichota bacterium]